jgi:methylenetetrahydrofolate reductase (NADPH)
MSTSTAPQPVSAGPDLAQTIARLCGAASFEISVHEIEDVERAGPQLPAGTPVSITWLPKDSTDQRVAMAARLRAGGHEPIPHVGARHIASEHDLGELLARLQGEADVRRVFVIAGDLAAPRGPFASALDVLRSEAFTRSGIRAWGVATYPEGHPKIGDEQLAEALRAKADWAAQTGAEAFAITQLCFDAAPILRHVSWLRDQGYALPVRLGLAGPASLTTLMKFAARCGVGASARAIASRGASLARLLVEAGPDPVIRDLAVGLDADRSGPIDLHFFPFGGFARTVRWVRAAAEGRFKLASSASGFEILPETVRR